MHRRRSEFNGTLINSLLNMSSYVLSGNSQGRVIVEVQEIQSSRQESREPVTVLEGDVDLFESHI